MSSNPLVREIVVVLVIKVVVLWVLWLAFFQERVSDVPARLDQTLIGDAELCSKRSSGQES